MKYRKNLLATEKKFLRDNHKKLAKEYPGKYLLIKGRQVYGAYETYEEGAREAARMFGAGPCLLRSVLQPGDKDPDPIFLPVVSLHVPMSGSGIVNADS